MYDYPETKFNQVIIRLRMTKKLFISNNLDEILESGISIKEMDATEIIEDRTKRRLGGTNKKGHVSIAGENYVLKNHSYLGYDDSKKSSFSGNVKRQINKRLKIVNAGTKDIRYRYIGTPVDNNNLMSIREVLSNLMLRAISNNVAFDHDSKPFYTTDTRLVIDQYPGTTLPRFRVLSKFRNFTPLDHFVHSATTGEALNPYSQDHSAKNKYAILPQNQIKRTNPATGEIDLIPADPKSLAFASIIPTLLADYDIPGTNGCNIAMADNSNKLLFFDFGHSLIPGRLLQTNVTSDLKPHDFPIAGNLNQRRYVSFSKRANMIRRFKGETILSAPLKDKIAAFKQAYETFIDPHSGKESQLMLAIRSSILIEFNQLEKHGVLSAAQMRFYRKKTFDSLNAFVKRLKHIQKIVEPRLNLNEEELNLLETVELLSSSTIPSNVSPTGFIFHEDKVLTGITHRHAFEIKDGKLVTGHKEAADMIRYFIHRENLDDIKPAFSKGLYSFPLDSLPKHWSVSPFQEEGKETVGRLLKQKHTISRIYQQYSTLFIKFGGLEQTNPAIIDNFAHEIMSTINGIKHNMQSLSIGREAQQKMIFQFLNTPCHESSPHLTKGDLNEKHQTLWDVLHQILEKSKDPHSAIYVVNEMQLSLIEKEFSPAKLNSIYHVTENGVQASRS